MATVADLYAQALGRPASQIDPEGLAYWTQMFGPEVDKDEAATFLSVAKVIEPEVVQQTQAKIAQAPDLDMGLFTPAAAPAAPAILSQQDSGSFNPFSSSINVNNLGAAQKLDVNNLPSTYGAIYNGTGGDTGADPTPTGYFSTNELVNGVPVTTYYDAQGNVTKYVAANTTKALSGTERLSAEWDPTGKATPVQWSVDNGLFNSGITFDDATKAAILAMVGAGTLGQGTAVPTGGEAEALSGIDLGGVGASPNTWMGGSTYGTVPAAISSTIPAGTEEPLSGIDLGGRGGSPNTWLGNGTYGVVPAAISSTVPAGSTLTASQVIKALPLVSTVASLVGDGGSGGGGGGSTGSTGFGIVPIPDTWKSPTYTGNTGGTGGTGGVGGTTGGFTPIDLSKIFTNQNLLTGTQWEGLPNQRNLTFNDIFAAGQQSTPMGSPVNINNLVSAILGQTATS